MEIEIEIEIDEKDDDDDDDDDDYVFLLILEKLTRRITSNLHISGCTDQNPFSGIMWLLFVLDQINAYNNIFYDSQHRNYKTRVNFLPFSIYFLKKVQVPWLVCIRRKVCFRFRSRRILVEVKPRRLDGDGDVSGSGGCWILSVDKRLARSRRRASGSPIVPALAFATFTRAQYLDDIEFNSN
uniref:Uncharacterized protein n=1 Tax=Vespula pensylvanica TaxID=30213 RepID=A0A834NLT4_VESPE|nr:hypothetical protein H0235_012639 [Vespula pensylvanica]